MVNYNDIFKNKPKNDATWQLEISAQIGSMQDDRFIPMVDVRDLGLSLVVAFDDQLLINHRFQSQDRESWQWGIQDRLDSSSMITITLKGKSRLADLGEANLVTKISVNVEGFCIDDLIEDTPCYFLESGETKAGACIMGEDGSIKFEIALPVYRWIFDHASILEKNYQFYQKP